MTTLTDFEMEKNIAAKIVDGALALNYSVSVFDGEEYAVKRSSNRDEILNALNSTGTDNLRIWNSAGHCVGVVFLVWGNEGWALINDYTATPLMEAMLQGANELSDKYAEEADQ